MTKRIARDASGATKVEYVLALVCVALVALGTWVSLGAAVEERVACAAGALEGGAPCSASASTTGAHAGSRQSLRSDPALSSLREHSPSDSTTSDPSPTPPPDGDDLPSDSVIAVALDDIVETLGNVIDPILDALVRVAPEEPAAAPAPKGAAFPVDPAGEGAREIAARLVTRGGKAGDWQEQWAEEQVAKLPIETLRRFDAAGGKVVVGKDNVAELLPELSGKPPRGWPPGSTWDQVTGTAIDGTAYVCPGLIPLLNSAEAADTLFHEIGHAIDELSGTLSLSSEFDGYYTATQFTADEGYFKQGGEAGPSEAFAESFAQYVAGTAREHDWPELERYWQTEPLEVLDPEFWRAGFTGGAEEAARIGRRYWESTARRSDGQRELGEYMLAYVQDLQASGGSSPPILEPAVDFVPYFQRYVAGDQTLASEMPRISAWLARRFPREPGVR